MICRVLRGAWSTQDGAHHENREGGYGMSSFPPVSGRHQRVRDRDALSRCSCLTNNAISFTHPSREKTCAARVPLPSGKCGCACSVSRGGCMPRFLFMWCVTHTIIVSSKSFTSGNESESRQETLALVSQARLGPGASEPTPRKPFIAPTPHPWPSVNSLPLVGCTFSSYIVTSYFPP